MNRSLAVAAMVSAGVITDIVANTASGHTRTTAGDVAGATAAYKPALLVSGAGSTNSTGARRAAARRAVRLRAAERRRTRAAATSSAASSSSATSSSSSSGSSAPAASSTPSSVPAASTPTVVAVSGGS